ncbi:hypothetical protein KR074_011167, partial [Drosophila pseudoananassae]
SYRFKNRPSFSCCTTGIKCIISLAFSFVGVLIIIGLVIYFCFFYNKSGETTKAVSDDSTEMDNTVKAMKELLETTKEPSRMRAFLHKLIDTF